MLCAFEQLGSGFNFVINFEWAQSEILFQRLMTIAFDTQRESGTRKGQSES